MAERRQRGRGLASWAGSWRASGRVPTAATLLLPAILLLTTCYPDPDELTGAGTGASGGPTVSGGANGSGGTRASGGTAAGGRPPAGGGSTATGGRGTVGGSVGTGTGSTSGMCTNTQPAATGGDCTLPACGCPAGQVCYPRSTTMNLGCFVSDNIAEGQSCDGKVCASGLGCFGSVCKRYCTTATDCPAIDGASGCAQATWPNGMPINGVLVCKRVCDPTSPQAPRAPLLACPAGFACTADKANPGASECLRTSGTKLAGAACMNITECAPGHTCLASGACAKYCFKTVGCPVGAGTCTSLATPIFAGRQEVGVCVGGDE